MKLCVILGYFFVAVSSSAADTRCSESCGCAGKREVSTCAPTHLPPPITFTTTFPTTPAFPTSPAGGHMHRARLLHRKPYDTRWQFLQRKPDAILQAVLVQWWKIRILFWCNHRPARGALRRRLGVYRVRLARYNQSVRKQMQLGV